MAKDRLPMTPALRALAAAGVPHQVRLYEYVDRGGTAEAARQLGVDHHAVVKTLVMADNNKKPLMVLMHGDREVSTKALARHLGVKTVAPVDPAAALRLTGYQVGGISPFGVRQRLPLYVERSILDLPRILINGGKRGLLVELDPGELARVLGPTPVEAAA